MTTMMSRISALAAGDKHKGAYVALATTGVLMAAAYYVVIRRPATRKKKKKHNRNISFTSVAMALGSFPENAKVPAATINTACYFRTCPSVEELAEQVVEPLLIYERFSQILDTTTHAFRPSKHPYKAQDLVREIVIRGDENDTHRTIFDHLQDVLSEGRNDLPWWEILVVRNERASARGSAAAACVIRVHHSLADGLALNSAFQKIMVTEDGSPLQLLTDKLRPPQRHSKNWFATAWSLLQATIHVLTLGATPFDDDTAFSKHNHAEMVHSGQRDFVLFPEIPLSFVRAIKSAAGATVNDVLMAAVSQAIYEYCKQQKDAVLNEKGADLQCRALLPVGFPRSPLELSDPATALSNKWCLVSCGMAVGCSNVADRLAQIHRNTSELKSKPRAYMTLKIQNTLVPWLPHALSRQTVMDLFSRHSLVLTNVPGPSQKIRLAGQTVDKVQLFFENTITQVDLMSYGGTIFGNIIYDPVAMPGLQENFGRSYALALVDLANELQVKEVPAHLLALRQ